MKGSINPMPPRLMETGGQGPLLSLPSPFSVPSHNAHGVVDQPKEPNDGQGCKFMKADSSSQHQEELANGNSHFVLSAWININ